MTTAPPPFLLCDPALVAAPGPTDDVSASREFWVRLIAWSGDRRVRLGRECRALVLDELAEAGWPDYHPPRCPGGLAGIAAQRLNVLLTSLAAADENVSACSEIPTLDPEYVRSETGALALAMDLRTSHCRSLVGVATTPSSWKDTQANTVNGNPPPPRNLPLVSQPQGPARGERDVYASIALHGRKLTVVGARRDDEVVRVLMSRLAIPERAIRWIECEKGRQPSLDRLGGMQSGRDLLGCVTGHIGHAGSQKALGLAKKRCVQVVCVEHPGGLPDALSERFGDAP